MKINKSNFLWISAVSILVIALLYYCIMVYFDFKSYVVRSGIVVLFLSGSLSYLGNIWAGRIARNEKSELDDKLKKLQHEFDLERDREKSESEKDNFLFQNKYNKEIECYSEIIGNLSVFYLSYVEMLNCFKYNNSSFGFNYFYYYNLSVSYISFFQVAQKSLFSSIPFIDKDIYECVYKLEMKICENVFLMHNYSKSENKFKDDYFKDDYENVSDKIKERLETFSNKYKK